MKDLLSEFIKYIIYKTGIFSDKLYGIERILIKQSNKNKGKIPQFVCCSKFKKCYAKHSLNANIL